MKNLFVCSMLLLCACAASSKTLRGGAEPIEGEWRGVLTRGDARAMTEIDFTGREPRLTVWGPENMPIPPESVDARPAPATGAMARGRAIHFEVPLAGIFDGVVDGETMQGTFTDATGSGTFRLERKPTWDGLQHETP